MKYHKRCIGVSSGYWRHTMRVMLVTLIFGIIMAIGAAQPTSAANFYRLNNGQNVEVDEHSVCQKVTNSSGNHILIPTRSATEWSRFRTYKPAGVSLAACAPVCGGTMVGGYCWYLGEFRPKQTQYERDIGESCTEVCSDHGGVNMTGTLNYAGSGGTLGNCEAVLTAILGAGNTLSAGDDVNCYRSESGGIGCGVSYNTYSSRCTGKTTTANAYHLPQDMTHPGVKRACACNN